MEGNSTAGSFTPAQQFSVADLVVVVVYFSLNVAVGIWVRVFSLVPFLLSFCNSRLFFFFLFRAGFFCMEYFENLYYFLLVVCARFVFCVLRCVCSVLLYKPSIRPVHPLWKDSRSLRMRWNEPRHNPLPWRPVCRA